MSLSWTPSPSGNISDEALAKTCNIWFQPNDSHVLTHRRRMDRRVENRCRRGTSKLNLSDLRRTFTCWIKTFIKIFDWTNREWLWTRSENFLKTTGDRRGFHSYQVFWVLITTCWTWLKQTRSQKQINNTMSSQGKIRGRWNFTR